MNCLIMNRLIKRFQSTWINDFLPVDGSENCVEVLQPSQQNGAMSSLVSLPNHFYWASLDL